MQGEFRRVVVAMVVALGLYVVVRYALNTFLPPAPPPPPAVTAPASGPSETGSTPAPTPTQSGPTTTAAAASSPAHQFYFTAADNAGPIQLGGGEKDALQIELRPYGATIGTLWLCERNKKSEYVFRAKPHVETPYRLLAPVEDGLREYYSFATYRLWIKEYDNQNWELDNLTWRVAEQTPEQVTFTTTLGTGQTGEDLLRVTKTYALVPQKPIVELTLSVENVSDRPLTVWLEQNGPVGVPAEHQQYDMRRLLTTQFIDGAVKLNKGHQHSDLLSAAKKGETVELLEPDQGPFLWTALVNKYFGVYTRPLPEEGGKFEDYIRDARGTVVVPGSTENLGDLLARMTTTAVTLQPETSSRYTFDIYAGPKDTENVGRANPAYADKTALYYQLARSADTRCCCTFLWLEDIMVWLLSVIHAVVRNYGVAIIILVIIIRSLLHPLTVFQQKSMFRMQDAMARMQPKMDAIKEKYANDKVKQNQETMKLWGEEGVNPLANFVSFLPLMLQMPILIALWTALNTDIHLRHAPFDGWWIRDLSAPDAAWSFNPPVTVPILSDIPLVGGVFKNVAGINLLPILMGVSMWLQQKYMPKPHMQAKLAAAKQSQTKSKSGLSPQDQMRQQQIMMYMMAIVFPLMFYKMPAGLNLYWMATNVFGIFESLIIRKQLDREKALRPPGGGAGAADGARPKPKKDGPLARFFKHIASQAEEIQRKADSVSEKDATGKKLGKKKKL